MIMNNNNNTTAFISLIAFVAILSACALRSNSETTYPLGYHHHDPYTEWDTTVYFPPALTGADITHLIETTAGHDNGVLSDDLNLYIVSDRDYPEDCYKVFADYTLIGYYCPTSEPISKRTIYTYEHLEYYD